MNQPDEMLTTEEAAKVLGCEPTTLRLGRCGKGKINPPYVRMGRMIRYSKADLKAYIDSHRIDTEDQGAA